MRWDALFADLEAQSAAQQSLQLQLEIEEARELERARVLLADRLRWHLHAANSVSQVRMLLRGGQWISCRLRAVGADWIAGESGGYSVVLPLQSVHAVDDLVRSGVRQQSPAREHLRITAPLRTLMRERLEVAVLGGGSVGLEEIARGRIVSVGLDHVDALVTEASGQGRGRPTKRVRSIPLDAVLLFRSAVES